LPPSPADSGVSVSEPLELCEDTRETRFSSGEKFSLSFARQFVIGVESVNYFDSDHLNCKHIGLYKSLVLNYKCSH